MNVTEPFNFSTYAVDAVTTLAIALNETLTGSSHLNLSLGDAIKSTVFTGTSVRLLKHILILIALFCCVINTQIIIIIIKIILKFVVWLHVLFRVE